MHFAGDHREGEAISRWRKRAGRESGEAAGRVERPIEVDSSASIRIGFLHDEKTTASVGRDARGLIGEHHEESLATGVGEEGMFDAVDLESKRAGDLMRFDELRDQGHVDGGAFRGWLEDRVDSSIRIEWVSIDASEHPKRLRRSITDSQGRSLLAMNVGDVKAADPEHAGASVAVIGQNDGFVRRKRDVVQAAEVVLARSEGDLAVLSEHEPSGVFCARVGKHDSIPVRRPGGSQDRLARFQPDQADQAEPAFGLSQFGVSIPNPVGMFFVERGHGGRGGCFRIHLGRSAGSDGEWKEKDEQVSRSHCCMLVDQRVKGNRWPDRRGSEGIG